MNSRRLSIVLFIFAGAVLAFTFFVQKQKGDRQTVDQAEPASQPAAVISEPSVETAEVIAATPAVESPAEPAPLARPVDAPQPEPAPPTRELGQLRLFAGRAPAETLRIGSLESDDGYTFQVDVSSRGAAVKRVRLTDYFATVADKQRQRRSPADYEAAVLDNPDKYKGHYEILSSATAKDGREYLPMSTGRLAVKIDSQDDPLSVNLATLDWQPVLPPSPASTDAQTASFEVVLQCGTSPADAQPMLRIVKTYTVKPDDYTIAISLALENLWSGAVTVTIDQAGPTYLSREDPRRDMRQVAYAYQQAEDQAVQNQLKPMGKVAELPVGQRELLGYSSGRTPMLWAGLSSKFFASMIYLRPRLEGRLDAPEYEASFYIIPEAVGDGDLAVRVGVEIPAIQLAPGKTKQVAFDVFAGPKKRSLFTSEKDSQFKPLYRDLKYIGTLDFGGCVCTFSWLALAMMSLLDIFSMLAFGNYGVAIIILVLLVRLVLHPLTKKSQVSMMGMQKLSPKIQKIKEKYADDKTAQNKEMMKVYKQQGAGPLLGCLPMMLQMPIWIALYTGLNAAVELRHAAFLPVWITDLAAPDALISWSESLPLIGNTFNLLPILLSLAMFLQQKYSPQTAASATGSDQAQQQQKMMQYMMPVMMLMFFYKAPSGLTLYIMASTFAGLLDQYYVRKHIRGKEAAEAASQTTVTVPGKAARTARPKKPKGPFWTKRG